MANAAIDQNSDQTITARLNTDGVTIVRITADDSTHAMKVTDGTTGTPIANNFAATDQNGRPTMFAVSSVDGVTLVPLQADSLGALLINSN